MPVRTVNALRYSETPFHQSENAALTYTVNWAGVLDTDTISTSTWSCEASSVTIAGEANTTTTASARLSASAPGTYRVVNKIVTAAGDTDERVVVLMVAYNDESRIDGDYWTPE